jgi:putative Mn2+ efflux pump MntP
LIRTAVAAADKAEFWMAFFFEVFILGLVLSADSFSAAVALGSKKFSRSDLLKFAFASGFAEMAATVAGYLAGAKVIKVIADYDHWVAFGLLAAIALHLLWEGYCDLRSPEDDEPGEVEHSFLKILFISVATSLDALGVGIGLGIAEKPIVPFAISIGIWAFFATVIGVYIGNHASKKLGPIFTIIAGLVLGALSLKMLSI